MSNMQQLDEQISDALSNNDVSLAAELYCNRAAAHARVSAFQQALADCSAAVEHDPSLPKAYLGRAKLFARMGYITRALEELEVAQRRDTIVHLGGSAIGDVGQKAARLETELRAAKKVADAKAAAAAEAAARKARAKERAHEFSDDDFSDDFFFGFDDPLHDRRERERRERRRSSSAGPRTRVHGKADHYAVLGVEPTADTGAIRKAYKKLCLKYHPDKAGVDAPTPEKEEKKKKFLEVQDAYETLSDASRRRAYDATSPFAGGFSADDMDEMMRKASTCKTQ